MSNTIVNQTAVFGQVEVQNYNSTDKKNLMKKENTKSAGVSHPAAKMDNRGKNIDKYGKTCEIIHEIH